MDFSKHTGEGPDLRWLILLTVIIGTFLGRLDQTIVNLAMPKMIDDFGITVAKAGWIATAYILANAVFVPVWGKLGDTIGRKKVYVLGFLGFIVGSVLAAFAWSFNSMIFFRVIQAVAGSADYPTAMAILAATFTDGKERAQALGIWSASFMAASVFGPLIGGPLVDTFGWRSIFMLNLPVGLIGLAMAMAYIKESVSGHEKPKRFDFLGSAVLGTCLATLVLVLEKGNGWGWLSGDSAVCYAIVVLSAVAFWYVEKRQEDPIIDFKFFRNTVFVNTIVNNFVVFMGMMGSLFLLPVFAQTFLGYNATQTGFLFMPMAFAMMAAAPLGGALIGRVQPRYVIFASTVVAGIGILMFARLDAKSTSGDIIMPLLIMAFGMGFGMAQRTNLVAAVVPAKEIGVASSILALVRNIAGAFGIAVFGSLLTNSIASHGIDIARASVINVHDLRTMTEFLSLISLKAQIMSYATVYKVSAAVVFLGSLLALKIVIPKGAETSRVEGPIE
jgi:DHA2 family multidrug resistance protein